jgi:integrase/recombinase XerD
MDGSKRARVTGPLELHALGFADELRGQGYLRRSIQKQLELMDHVSGWLTAEGLDAAGFTLAAGHGFLAARRSAGCTRYVSPKALMPLLGYLRSLGVAPPPPEPDLGLADALLERYRRWLLAERGLGEGTVRGYVGAVRPFVVERLGEDGLDMAGLTARDVTEFVVAACPSRPRGPAGLIVTALRSMLGFLHVAGLISTPLAEAVPSVASWRLAGLPQPLEPGELRQMLIACDKRTVVGQRDYAMLVLLGRLGLRCGEVARLGLDDIDWRAGEIVIAGKGPTLERLPLPVDVGEAIADYLYRARPATAEGRTVFVRVQAPHRALSSGGVTQAVFAAGKRAGLGSIYAHRLRHSAASAVLRAGAPLPEVGQLLRHRRLLTTAIYAKVDREALRSITRPWPGGVA